MSGKPIAYIFHGKCELPTTTKPYHGVMVLQKRSVHVERCGPIVSRNSLQMCKITIGDDLFSEGFIRVDILGARDFDPSNDYGKELSALRMQRIDLRNLNYREATELFAQGIVAELNAHKRAICPLYSVSPDWDPDIYVPQPDCREIQFHLTLSDHRSTIDKVIRQIQQKDTQPAVTAESVR